MTFDEFLQVTGYTYRLKPSSQPETFGITTMIGIAILSSDGICICEELDLSKVIVQFHRDREPSIIFRDEKYEERFVSHIRYRFICKRHPRNLSLNHAEEPTFDECMTLWDCTYDVSYYGSGYIDITINTPYDFHLRERLPSSCCHVEMYTRDIKPCVVVFTNKWFEEYKDVDLNEKQKTTYELIVESLKEQNDLLNKLI